MQVKRSLFSKNAARALLLTAAFTALLFPAFSQEREVELPVATMTAHDVIDAVQGQTDYLFTTNSNTRLDALTVAVTVKKMTVKALLEKLLSGSGLTYRMSGNYIVVTPAPAVQKAATAPRTADVYTRSDISGISAAPRRRPAPLVTPVSVAEAPAVPADPLLLVANVPPVSRYEPVSRYAATQ